MNMVGFIYTVPYLCCLHAEAVPQPWRTPSVRGSSHTSVHIPALDQAWSLLLCYHEKELGFFSVEAQKPLEKEDQNSLQGGIEKVPWRECTK